MVMFHCRCPKQHAPSHCSGEVRKEHDRVMDEIVNYLLAIEDHHREVLDSITKL